MSAPDLEERLLRRGEVLKRRAEALARRDEGGASKALLDTVVVVQVGSERFGISLGVLDEIVPLTPMAELPRLPAWFPGLIQVRGRLLSVLDLAAWFEVAGPSRPRHLAVLEGPRGQMGALVDAVIDILEVHPEDIATTFAFDDVAGRKAITKDLVTLIDADALLGSPRIMVDLSATPRQGRS